MTQDELTREDLNWLAKPREPGSRNLFTCGMSEEEQIYLRANILLRKFLGETPKQAAEYFRKANSEYMATSTYHEGIISIGQFLLNTPISEDSASWYSHWTGNLGYRLRAVSVLEQMFGFKVSPVLTELEKNIHEEESTEIGARDTFTTWAILSMNGEELTEEKLKSGAAKTKNERLNDLHQKRAGVILIPQTQTGATNVKELYRVSLERALEKYRKVRAEKNPELQNYNRKSDILHAVARLGIIAEFDEKEISSYLARVQAMNFNKTQGEIK